MPSYAANYTPRVRLTYVAAGIEHTIQMRGPRGANSAAMDAKIGSIRACFNFMLDKLASDFAWVSAEFAATDDDNFIPTSMPAALVGAAPVATFTKKQRCRSTGFVGSTAGSRAAIFFYGILWGDALNAPADNGRVTPAEYAAVASVVTELSGQAYAGNGLSASFKNYANIKDNDGLLQKLRSGAIS